MHQFIAVVLLLGGILLFFSWRSHVAEERGKAETAISRELAQYESSAERKLAGIRDEFDRERRLREDAHARATDERTREEKRLRAEAETAEKAGEAALRDRDVRAALRDFALGQFPDAWNLFQRLEAGLEEAESHLSSVRSALVAAGRDPAGDEAFASVRAERNALLRRFRRLDAALREAFEANGLWSASPSDPALSESVEAAFARVKDVVEDSREEAR